MAQPSPQPGAVYHAASRAQKMMGKFIQSPQPRECCGRDWRHAGTTYKRHQKRALSQFRRRDGTRWILEGLAAMYSHEAELEAALEQARLDAEYDAAYDDDYDYECEPDSYEHDGSYYFDEAREADYYKDQFYGSYDEWSDPYAESDYDRGYREGMRDAMRINQRIS